MHDRSDKPRLISLWGFSLGLHVSRTKQFQLESRLFFSLSFCLTSTCPVIHYLLLISLFCPLLVVLKIYPHTSSTDVFLFIQIIIHLFFVFFLIKPNLNFDQTFTLNHHVYHLSSSTLI